MKSHTSESCRPFSPLLPNEVENELVSVSHKLESTANASMLDLKMLQFSRQKSGSAIEKKEDSGCATPKENMDTICFFDVSTLYLRHSNSRLVIEPLEQAEKRN